MKRRWSCGSGVEGEDEAHAVVKGVGGRMSGVRVIGGGGGITESGII